MVDACVYTWAFSLLRLGRLAMPLINRNAHVLCLYICYNGEHY